MSEKYTPVIGLEIHIELATKSKMFCGCSADYFGEEPNTLTCPVCLGLPGALPVPNKKAIEWTIMLGMALNCEIAKESKFDRKNYFYPDLPKGYQISQYDEPMCVNGKLELNVNGQMSNVGITRVHLEEDTGKLLHRTIEGDKVTLIDFNRSGVPLVEIVTEPDLESSKEADIFLKQLRQIIRYLGISDADMEKGSMRIEPNISVMSYESTVKSKTSTKDDPSLITHNSLPSYKVEVKNINSFKFVRQAIDYEIARQTELLEKGEIPQQETRGWNEDQNKTVPQRRKEEAHDYRYFPEPDIPPLVSSDAALSRLKANLPELPQAKTDRFAEEYSLSDYDAQLLTVEKELADWFEEAVRAYVQTAHPGIKSKSKSQKAKVNKSAYAKLLANWIIGDMAALMKQESVSIGEIKVVPAYLAELLYLVDKGDISQTAAKKVFAESFKTGVHPAKIIEDQELSKMEDTEQLEAIIQEVLQNNSSAVEDYKAGKKEAIGFLVGQVMQKTRGRADAKEVKQLIADQLNN